MLEVDVPKLMLAIILTHLYVYVVSCVFMNSYRRDTCLKEIELHIENMLTIIDSLATCLKGPI